MSLFPLVPDGRPRVQLDLSEDAVKGEGPVEATFTYSVQWRATDTPYEKRMDKYRRYQFLPQHLEARSD